MLANVLAKVYPWSVFFGHELMLTVALVATEMPPPLPLIAVLSTTKRDELIPFTFKREPG